MLLTVEVAVDAMLSRPLVQAVVLGRAVVAPAVRDEGVHLAEGGGHRQLVEARVGPIVDEVLARKQPERLPAKVPAANTQCRRLSGALSTERTGD